LLYEIIRTGSDDMSQKIQIRRGLKSELLPNGLSVGELGFCTDTHELYIGSSVGNIFLNNPPNTKYLHDYTSLSNGGTDWAPAINQAIIDLNALGGGILEIPAGTHLIHSTIALLSNVHIVGQGKAVTNIKLDSGVDADILNIDTHSNCGIRDLSIKGNVWDASPAINRTGVVIGRAGININANEGNMPNTYIHNIEIRDVSGDGFHCFQGTWQYALSRVDINFCKGYGANIESTDNLYDLMTVTGNGKYGLYIKGSNNHFNIMKVINNGRGDDLKGSVGTDFQNAGVYDSGKRNTFVSIETQENYGHGFVFDGAVDTDLIGCLADANGLAMIANNRATGTAIGFYFQNCQRMNGSLKATVFKATISQVSGYYIDAGSSDLSFDYENDHAQTDTNLSSSCIIMTTSTKRNMYSATQYTTNKQYSDFIASNTVLNNTITSYDGANLQLGAIFQTSTTIDTVNHDVLATLNWGVGQFPRIGSTYRSVTQGRTYLVRLKVKPTINNYFLRLIALYDEGAFTVVKNLDGNYNSSVYSDVTFTFQAGVTSTKFLFYVTDKPDGITPNATQGSFHVKDLAFVDITDALTNYYLPTTLDKAVRDNYFMGSKTFSSSAGVITPLMETAWEDWVPTLTWTTATPVGVVSTARRKLSGKTVFITVAITATDGNGATGLKINVPSDMLPKQNSMYPPFYNTVIVGTTTNVNRQLNLRDDSNADINYGFLGTATAGQALKVYFQGFYELP
jgi:hypothetical protein